MSPTLINSTAEEDHIKGKSATVMLSCFADAVQQPAQKRKRLSRAKSTMHQECEDRDVSSIFNPIDKNCFFMQLGLMSAHSCGLQEQISTTVEVQCIIIDDDDDDDTIPRSQDSCITDLFGTTRPLRGDVQVNGGASSRLLQPSSRLRKLLNIDITSTLGQRTLQSVMSTLNKDDMPLNPYTVSHSLAGSENSLDYGMFCRTPVKGTFNGRLRCREYPVKYRLGSAGTHYHYYCFNSADRRRFCRRFDSGLSARSYRLRQRYNRCSVVLEQLMAQEITDWRTSQRLRDYVARMQEKDKEKAAVMNSSHRTADEEVICLSSDSEDEAASRVKKQDLMFRCHQCDVKLSCGDSFRGLIRDHYRKYHGIVNIDIVRIAQPDGSMTMQIIHVPTTVTPSSGVEANSRSNNAEPSGAQLVRRTWTSAAGEPLAASGKSDHPVPLSHVSPQFEHAVTNSVPVIPLPRKLFGSNSALLNGTMPCRGYAVSSSSAAVQPACDADVICLD